MRNLAVVVWSGCGPMWSDGSPYKLPTWPLIPPPSVLLPFRSALLNNCCVWFMTSTMPRKESAAMRVPRPRAAPPRQPDSLIAPPQLWQHLSVGQQQHVRKILLGVAQQLVAYLPSPSPCEETPHDARSHLECSATHPAASRTPGGDLHSPIEPQASA